jgi:hypothetical protein
MARLLLSILPCSLFEAIQSPTSKSLKSLGNPDRGVAIPSRIREVCAKLQPSELVVPPCRTILREGHESAKAAQCPDLISPTFPINGWGTRIAGDSGECAPMASIEKRRGQLEGERELRRTPALISERIGRANREVREFMVRPRLRDEHASLF